MAADQSTTRFTFVEGGAMRWMSLELLDPERFGLKDSRPTKESDCYSLGMVIYEVLSGQVPFAPHRDFTAMLKIAEGERPERPQGEEGRLFTDGIWSTLELCWKHQPHDRISANAVLLHLEGHPPMSRK
jgi:serine/threonine protein kinase